MKLLGIDTGGTFTDLVYYDGKSINTHKVLSTPDAPERAILQGIKDMQIRLNESLHLIHGSTVATNAVLEGKGAKTVYITNRGFKDVLTIGRQARRELYNLTPEPTAPPVPSEQCLETGGRITADGEVLEALTETDLQQLGQQLATIQPQAVAINLLFSYLDPGFEEQIAATINDDVFVSCSSKILPVYREYERGITTWLNAYVGPLMQGYLRRLQQQLADARLSIMRSSGLTCDARQAGEEAVHLLLSGPAGGLAAAHYLSGQLHSERLLSFDMGGTSTDVALLDGDIELTGAGAIAGYPVGVPMVNIHTIGAGGGSIAYVDEGGLLQVGPESAGARPGPACYGQGGRAATVTDANLVLGRIPATVSFGQSLQVDLSLAEQAIATLTRQLGLQSNQETALGIIRVANEHMAQALRVISVERGVDPRQFILAAFGGAGGLHVCELAEQLEMQHAVVPGQAGVLSAYGMLVAAPGRELTRTVGRTLGDIEDAEIQQLAEILIQEGREKLLLEGHPLEDLRDRVSLELCYQGQAHTLAVDWSSDSYAALRAFEQQHLHRYGHRLDSPVELVNIRVGVKLANRPTLPTAETGQAEQQSADSKLILRTALQPGQPIQGPVSICDTDATVWVAPGWQASVNSHRHLLLSKD